jgi:hypothetical protein
MSSLLVFNRVYRLEIQSVSHVGIFDRLCELSPLTFYLVSSTPPHPDSLCEYVYSILYNTRIQCVREGGTGS